MTLRIDSLQQHTGFTTAWDTKAKTPAQLEQRLAKTSEKLMSTELSVEDKKKIAMLLAQYMAELKQLQQNNERPFSEKSRDLRHKINSLCDVVDNSIALSKKAK